MKKIQENLNQYREYAFFSLLEQSDAERQLKEKKAAQDNKDAQDIIKKVKDNFARFRSFAGNQIENYKNFWDMQINVRKAVQSKDMTCKVIYAMFNDDNSNKYNPDYIICVRGGNDGVLSLCVIKTHPEEGENNLVFSVVNKQAVNDFINFYAEFKDTMREVKDNYIKAVETKKQEKEHKEKREKLETFLKESFSVDDDFVVEGWFSKEEENDNTLLVHAASKGKVDLIKKALDAGADIDYLDKGLTALMLASRNNNINAVQFLLDNGANINIKGKNGWKAFDFAHYNGNKDIIKLLSKARTNPENNRDISGSYTMHPEKEVAIHESIDGNIEFATQTLENIQELRKKTANWVYVKTICEGILKGKNIETAIDDVIAVVGWINGKKDKLIGLLDTLDQIGFDLGQKYNSMLDNEVSNMNVD